MVFGEVHTTLVVANKMKIFTHSLPEFSVKYRLVNISQHSGIEISELWHRSTMETIKREDVTSVEHILNRV